MRSAAFISAAFAAAAMAVPLNEKRVYDYVTDTAVVMVTDVVTVTANGPAPAYTSYAPAPPPPHHHHHHHHHSSYAPPPPSSSAPPPPPSSTEQPTSTYVPPPPSSTYQPPTTTYAPPPSSSAPPPASSSAPSSGGSYPLQPYGGSTGGADYQAAVLNHHNIHRANHSASPLTWDDTLAGYAKTVAASCSWGHNTDVGGGGYGQNIAAGIQDSVVAQSITNMFYNGEMESYSACYGEANPDNCNFESCGHFTQVVWKDTKTVGCWTYDCSATGMSNLGSSDIPPYFTVCNYGPPGNYGGEYGENVGRPLGHPTVSVPS